MATGVLAAKGQSFKDVAVDWTIRGQSDPERNNYLSGMIPSAWDADASLRPMQSGARGWWPHSRDHSPPGKRRRCAYRKSHPLASKDESGDALA